APPERRRSFWRPSGVPSRSPYRQPESPSGFAAIAKLRAEREVLHARQRRGGQRDRVDLIARWAGGARKVRRRGIEHERVRFAVRSVAEERVAALPVASGDDGELAGVALAVVGREEDLPVASTEVCSRAGGIVRLRLEGGPH